MKKNEGVFWAFVKILLQEKYEQECEQVKLLESKGWVKFFS